MKKYITVLLLTILLFSCSNELYDTDSNENNQNTPSLKFGGDGKFDALGHGADVTQEFLATEKAAVIDNDKLNKEAPTRIGWNLNNRQYYTEYSGATASSMLKEIASKKAISVSAGYGSVSALFKASFEKKSSNRQTTNYSYGEYHLIVKKKEFRYNFSFGETGSAQIRKYVTDNFKEDVEYLSPKELIQIYGTHVYTHVVLGGELTVTYSSEILSTENKESKKMAVEAGMEASIGSLFKLSTSVEVSEEKNQELTQMNSNQKINYETRGGDSRLGVVGSISFDSNTQRQIDLTKWQESCTSENVNLIDFDPGTLIPLWMFVEPGAKQDALKQAIAKYIEENEFQDKEARKPKFILYPGDRLQKGDYMKGDSFFNNQPCILGLSEDGKLFVNTEDNAFKKMTGIDQLVMQKDGNLVAYLENGKPVWSSDTWRYNVSYFYIYSFGQGVRSVTGVFVLKSGESKVITLGPWF